MLQAKQQITRGKSSCQRRIFSWCQEKQICLIGNARRFDRESALATNR